MLSISSCYRYYVYAQSCDMRRSFDSLGAIVNNEMVGHLLSGDVFIFISKRRNQLKLLRWEGDGFGIYHKRLQSGTFPFPEKGELAAWELTVLLEG
ncbi:MAG TPA: IS66 family insertion sequence element accessory protein TnpB, partial [Arachidicoccus sp.]